MCFLVQILVQICFGSDFGSDFGATVRERYDKKNEYEIWTKNMKYEKTFFLQKRSAWKNDAEWSRN